MIGAVLAAMLLAAPVAPAPKDDPAALVREACGDDDGRDLCDRAVQEKIRLALDAEPAEALARRGVQGVRVFMVNGYGNDQPMVAILWEGKAAPAIEVRVDRGEIQPSILTLPGNSWHRASTRTLARLVRTSPSRQSDEQGPNAEGELVICLHAWVAVVEAIEGGRVHRRIRNACGDDPVFDGAFQFATMALGVSEACSAVDADSYRNDWGRLAVCPAILGPNVNGAAAVYEMSSGSVLETPTYPHDMTLDNLAAEVSWRSPGQTASGPEAVAAAWRGFAADGRASHWVRTATGKGAVVLVEGIAIRRSDEGTCHADSRQEWRQAEGRWRLVSWSLTECRPIKLAPAEPGAD